MLPELLFDSHSVKLYNLRTALKPLMTSIKRYDKRVHFLAGVSKWYLYIETNIWMLNVPGKACLQVYRITLRLNYSSRTLKRVHQRYRETGSWARLSESGRWRKTAARKDWCRGRLALLGRFASLRQLTASFNGHRAKAVII